MASETKEAAKGKKTKRRKKDIYGKIRVQMEFYFSDANLSKDRFLKKAIEATTDGYIDLATILKFNKIRAITGDIEVLGDAIKRTSTFLEVNPEKTHVRRTTPIEEPKNVDERTVYVECLPAGIDHDWVRKQFSKCGKVVYVSLPRYPSSRDLKGFAFVEFETIDGAEQACKELNNPPADLASVQVGMFPKSSTQWEGIKKNLPDEQIEATKEKAKELILSEKKEDGDNIQDQVQETKDTKNAANLKRRQTGNEANKDGSESVTAKRRKMEESFDEQKTAEEQPSETDKTNSAKKKSRKRKSRSKTVDVVTDGEENKTKIPEGGGDVVPEKKPKLEEVKPGSAGNDGDTSEAENSTTVEASGKASQESKKKTKRRRKKKARKEKEVAELRVIPKTEWLGLREEYLCLQKTSMNLLKKTLKTLKTEDVTIPEVIEKMEEEKKKGRQIEFVADTIIKVASENPLSRKNLKESVGEGVAYVDVKDGLLEGHIRCESSVAAQAIIGRGAEGYSFSPVTGDDEKQYWDKLVADRDTKFNAKGKHKKRGHQKLMDKARNASVDTVERKHIVFDEN